MQEKWCNLIHNVAFRVLKCEKIKLKRFFSTNFLCRVCRRRRFSQRCQTIAKIHKGNFLRNKEIFSFLSIIFSTIVETSARKSWGKNIPRIFFVFSLVLKPEQEIRKLFSSFFVQQNEQKKTATRTLECYTSAFAKFHEVSAKKVLTSDEWELSKVLAITQFSLNIKLHHSNALER